MTAVMTKRLRGVGLRKQLGWPKGRWNCRGRWAPKTDSSSSSSSSSPGGGGGGAEVRPSGVAQPAASSSRPQLAPGRPAKVARRWHKVVNIVTSSTLTYGCALCGSRGQSRFALMSTPCAGEHRVVQAADASHNIHIAGHVVFCADCGAYGAECTAKLEDVCRRSPVNAYAARSRDRLQRGRHPTNSEFLGLPLQLARPERLA